MLWLPDLTQTKGLTFAGCGLRVLWPITAGKAEPSSLVRLREPVVEAVHITAHQEAERKARLGSGLRPSGAHP